jgi:hypothetical protein
MRKSNLVAAVSAILLFCGAAAAKEKVEGAPKEKKICKVDRESKSRIPKKTCLSQAEWNLKSPQDDLDDAVGRLLVQGRID